MNCSHTKTESVQCWEYNDDWEKVYYYEDQEVSADVDIDLHRYKCTLCGRIGYYSQAAREHFEGNKHSDLIADSLTRMKNRNKL